jgi:hypothetical protein
MSLLVLQNDIQDKKAALSKQDQYEQVKEDEDHSEAYGADS